MFKSDCSDFIQLICLENSEIRDDLKEEIAKALQKNAVFLETKKIFARKMFPPISSMDMFKKRYANKNAKFVSENAITLPSAAIMGSADIKRVCKEIFYFLNKVC